MYEVIPASVHTCCVHMQSPGVLDMEPPGLQHARRGCRRNTPKLGSVRGLLGNSSGSSFPYICFNEGIQILRPNMKWSYLKASFSPSGPKLGVQTRASPRATQRGIFLSRKKHATIGKARLVEIYFKNHFRFWPHFLTVGAEKASHPGKISSSNVEVAKEREIWG